MELAVHLVQWVRQRLIWGRYSGILAAHDNFDANVLHQSGNGSSSNIKAYPAHLMPDLAHTIDLQYLLYDSFDFELELLITLGTIQQA